MRYEQTQIGKLIEQVKLAILSNTPIVYIPTQHMEVVQEMLFSKETANSIIPRMPIQGDKGNNKSELDTFFEKDKSIIDNYQVVQSFEASRIENCPMMYIIYMKDGKEWDSSVTASLVKFVRQYLGIKYTSNYIEEEKVKVTRQSLCLVVSPTFIPIPNQISPYTKTIYIESLSDEEIESIISSSMRKHGIEPQIVTGKEELFSQMKVSFRGMSALKIGQLMQQMIKCQYIDFDGVLVSEVTVAIQDAKKELLNNCLGLKWEKVKQNEAAGLDNVVEWLKEHAPLFKDPEKAIRQNVDIPKGILITGVPGSGKSLMAMTAARLLNGMPLISLNMGLLRGGIVGESEHNLENALRTAESMAPCILWIDEIEKAMSGSSGDGNGDSGVGQRMFGTFLTWLQEKRSACFVFATSNDITRLPPELFRSERFDRKFFTYMPMVSECAMIFSSIIHEQNKEYWNELHHYSRAKMREMPINLFDTKLEECSVWIDILNKACTDRPEDCYLKEQNGRYLWNNGKKPGNKLLSGADISSIIKEAKFRAMRKIEAKNKSSADDLSDVLEQSVYGKELFISTVIEVIRGFKPYGETNLSNLAKSFRSLFQNQFEPASGNFILDFNDFDETEVCYTPHEPVDEGHCPNSSERYDRVLYHTLVGAINHYLPILEKKGEL